MLSKTFQMQSGLSRLIMTFSFELMISVNTPTVISGLISTAKAHTAGKWIEVPQYPSGKEYPPFPLGSFGHAVSLPLFERIAKHQGGFFDYHGEDSYLGIWLSQPNAPAVQFQPNVTGRGNIRKYRFVNGRWTGSAIAKTADSLGRWTAHDCDHR